MTTKADGVIDAARSTLPFLDPDEGCMTSFQNGIVEDAVAEAVGKQRVVGGIVGWEGTIHTPGVHEKTSPG